MDMITQTLLGAAAVQSVFARRLGRVSALIGAVSGELADADVFLPPVTDPALPFELHRHFTHALVFIPVGALLAMIPFLASTRLRKDWKLVYLACLLGYATHAPLDNCTSYGTHLLWPFVAERTAWDVMSIVDPIVTVPLLIAVVAGLITGRSTAPRIGLALMAAYVVLGVVQHARAHAVQVDLAEMRGHAIEHGRVSPTLGNDIVWRSVYRHDGMIHADAIRVPWFGAPEVREGPSIERFDEADWRAWSAPNADDPAVFRAFDAFADGFLAVTEHDGRRAFVGDGRFSYDAAGFSPIWGLRFTRAGAAPPVWSGPSSGDRALGTLWDEILGRDPRYVDPATIER